MRLSRHALSAHHSYAQAFPQVGVAEDARFELARGYPQHASNNADRRSPMAAAVRYLCGYLPEGCQ